MDNSKLEIERLVNSPINSNCYILFRKESEFCIVIDPAVENLLLFDIFFKTERKTPQYIIITHEHFDHISSVEYLRNTYKSKLIASPECSNRITDAKKNLSLFYDQIGFTCRPADIIVDSDSWKLNWEDFSFQFYLTPGHSEGGLCIRIDKILFTGDTLMKDFKTIVKLPGGNKEILKKSVEMLVKESDQDTVIFPGHGERFKLSDWNYQKN